MIKQRKSACFLLEIISQTITLKRLVEDKSKNLSAAKYVHTVKMCYLLVIYLNTWGEVVVVVILL
jgi:hypothetical protein